MTTISRVTMGFLSLLLLASLLVTPAGAAPVARAYSLPNGAFYTDANGQGGVGERGYAVLNSYWSPELNVRFADEFTRLGGVARNGYPASRPFFWDGFVTMVNQKVVFQWRSDTNTVAYVNVFDEMSKRGLDNRLYVQYQIPRIKDWSGDAGKSWNEIVQRHVAVLQHYPELGLAYYSVSDPVQLYGLPMSDVEDFGPFFAVRMQRAAFQQWKIDVPGIARRNQVTIVNGGDLSKELGLVPDWVGVPYGEPSWNDAFLVLEPGRNEAAPNILRVVGHGRVFETVFGWQVLNQTKTSILAQGNSRTQTSDGWSRFTFDVDLSSRPAGSYVLRLFVESPRDGSPINVLDVPFTK